MLFKNARIFRFTKPFQISGQELEESLAQDAFKPCGPQEVSRHGWVPPLGKFSDQLVHSAGGCHMVTLRREERLIPSDVIRDAVAEKCEAIEMEQGRKIRKKERDEIKDKVILQLLPHAFPRRKHTFAYIDTNQGYMVVDASTAREAENLASTLRKSLGSLPVRPPALEQAPAFTFTGWLNETIDLPDAVTLGTDCWLIDPSETGSKVTAKGLDLTSEEVTTHLNAGMQCTRLRMTWDDSVTFTFDEELALRGIKYGETIQEKLDDVDADDGAARFDAAFALMTLEFARMIPGLFDVMGGEDRSAIADGNEPAVVGIDPARPGADHTAAFKRDLDPEENPSRQGEDDPVYSKAVSLVTEERRVSISFLQRKLRIGYNRAANLVDAMEENGVVSAVGHNGAREVLAQPA